MTNQELLERYPFLRPRNVWTDEPDEDSNWTLLDCMPTGWRIAFGEQMCEEIREALIKHDYLDEYRILQIKEKWGYLHWYSNPAPQEVHDIINKYERISERICIRCGRPATKVTLGWVSPYCDCVDTDERMINYRYMPIEEYFKEIEEEG